MGPTGVLSVLLVALAVSGLGHVPASASLSDSATVSGTRSARRLAQMGSQRAADAAATSSSADAFSSLLHSNVRRLGRSLSQKGRKKPFVAPVWGSDEPVPAPNDSNVNVDTTAKRVFLTDEQIAEIEGSHSQQHDGLVPTVAEYRRRSTRRDRSLQNAANGVVKRKEPAKAMPANVCVNRDGTPNYNMLGYNNRNFTLDRYPYNTIVKLEVVEYNFETGEEGARFWCTATALSDIILVTSSHCVKPGNDADFPNIYTIAHYGYDGRRATLGTRISRCISYFDDYSEVDNALIVLKQPMKLPRYMPYGYVTNVNPRRNAVTWMLSYPQDKQEMTCLWDLGIDSPYYYGMVETRATTPNLNYRVGRRCEMDDQYAIWAMGSMIGGQSGGCLVHDRSGTCIGTAAYTCEFPDECSSSCPNAWGGFNNEFPLSDLWQKCGIVDSRDSNN